MVEIKEEIWKEIEFCTNYLVSNKGRVKAKERNVPSRYGMRLKREYMLGLRHNHNGYLYTTLFIDGKRRNFFVHRLVAYAFIGHPADTKLEVNHIDGNKENNTPSNLEWVTSSQNTQHSFDTGLQSKETLSIRQHNRKLTTSDVSYIKEEWSKVDQSVKGNKMKFYKYMAEKYNVDYTVIYRTVKGINNRFFN